MVKIYQRRKYAYVGIDMHKTTHTAVVMDCWTEKLGEVTFENRPGMFDKFIEDIKKICGTLTPVYGLEDTHGYGRSLAVYLAGKKFIVKDVNPAYGNEVRLARPTYKKDDSYDAYCVARVLRDMFDSLPDASNQDIFWTIRQLVKHRDLLVKGSASLQNQLHEQLVKSYPSYRKFFCDVSAKTSLYFWDTYPSPDYLKGVAAESLAEELKVVGRINFAKKAVQILALVEGDKVPYMHYQVERDFIVRSIVKEMRRRKEAIEEVDARLREIIPHTGYKLETMPGININTASHIISQVADINRFANADKLARFCGLAPVCFSSAGKGTEQKSHQGNRELHSILYFVAVQMVQVTKEGKPRHPLFNDYFQRKQKEGKNKSKALVCIMRRVVRILYGMMKNKTEYLVPDISSCVNL